MVVGPTALWPAKQPLRFVDRVFVDAGNAFLHQAVGVELPVFIAIGTEPVAAVIVIFVSEPDGDAIAAESPQLLDQPVIEFACPLAAEECRDLAAALQKLDTISPCASGRVGESNLGRVAAVSAFFSGANLLFCSFFGEWREWRA